MASEAVLWERLRAVATSGDAAWAALLTELEPELVAIARRQPIGRLRGSEDAPRDIVTRVFARLKARDYASIAKLCATDPPPVLGAWLRVVVRRAAIDVMRESPEYERGTETRPDRWVSLATLTSLAPAPADSLANQRALVDRTVRELVDRATAEFRATGDAAFTKLALEWKLPRIHVRRLATKGAQFIAVLAETLEGHTQNEIAKRLDLSRREVELIVRHLEELLRARLA